MKGIFKFFIVLGAIKAGWAQYNPVRDVVFNSFSRLNPAVADILQYQNGTNILQSHFKLGKDVVFLAHGWHGNFDNHFNQLLKNAIINTTDVNVVSIDWSVGAAGEYDESSLNQRLTGEHVANFIKWLEMDLRYNISKVSFVGFSLGGQMAGTVGRNLSGRIPFLVALDPASRGYVAPNSLTSSDGLYVEVLHTSSLSLSQAVGHNDFFFNNLPDMPGCGNDVGCSHRRSYQYYAESILGGKFTGVGCESVEQVAEGTCDRQNGLLMGGLKVKPAEGIFHLETNENSPYAKG